MLWRESEVNVFQSCSTRCNPMDYTELSMARMLEWVAFPFSGDLPNPGMETRSPTLQADSLPAEPQGKPRREVSIKLHIPHVHNFAFPVTLPVSITRSKTQAFG